MHIANRASVALVATTFLALAAHASECKLERYGELPVTMAGTMPVVSGTINGTQVYFLADSGAFFSMLSPAVAQSHNLKFAPMPMGLSVRGVGGTSQVQRAIVKDFSLIGFLGGRTLHDVDFMVGGSSLPSDRVAGLLGQNVLGGADTEYDLVNGFIRLFRAKDCSGKSLAYWHGTSDVAVMDIESRTPLHSNLIGKGKINGKSIRIMLDSGAWHSLLTLKAAARAGIKPEDDNVRALGTTKGVGKRSVETSLARFDELDLGGEKIRNAQLTVGDIGNDVDMLLGADFFLSHRVYIAAKQNKVYFTYNGGPVFDLGVRPKETKEPKTTDAPTTEPTIASTETDAPSSTKVGASVAMDAATLRRHGTALAGRRDYQGAIAELDQAVKLDPTEAENYYQRGAAKMHDRQGKAALADFDEALKLKADHIPALMDRGTLRLAMNNQFGAQADFDALLSLQPADTALSLRVAQMYVETRHFDQGITRLDQWITAHPKDSQLASALDSRCWSRVNMGKELDLALADCDDAIKRGLRTSEAYGFRGMVLLRQGAFDKAAIDFKESLKLQPKNPLPLYGLGIAQIKKGAKADGDKNIQAATAIAPTIGEFFKRLNLTAS